MGDFMKSAIDILSRNQNEDEQGFVGEIFEINGSKYKVKKFLAAGGFSNVYLASNTKGDLYAVKRLTGFDKEGCDKILKEIHLHKKLSNENIIKLLGVNYVQKNLGTLKVAEYLLLTEYCSLSLVDLIQEEFPINTNLCIMNQAINAVNYLHNLHPSVIHRDIKLENYLISMDGLLKLCDFGSATTEVIELNDEWNMQRRSNLQDEIFTNTSPIYRAPEIIDTWNNYPIGPKIDIWALGCVFFCLLYKKHPFDDGAKLRITNGNFTIPNIEKYSSFQNLFRECFIVNPRQRIDCKGIIRILNTIGEQNNYSPTEKINLLTINAQKQTTDLVNLRENGDEKAAQQNPFEIPIEEQRKIDETTASSVQSFLNSNGLLSSIKDGANSFLKNFIGTSTKVISSIQNPTRTNASIYNLTSRIIVSCQASVEMLQKYLENLYLPSNVSVYNFSGNNARLPPPVRTININQTNENSQAKVLDLEHLFYLIEEMFGFLNSGEKYILVLQDNKFTNIVAVIACALFLYTGLTELIEDALQIYAVKVQPISLYPSEFRYLNYMKKISKGIVPHNKSLEVHFITFKNFETFYQLFGDSKLLVEIFENNRLIFSQDRFALSNTINSNKLKISKKLLGNILVKLTLLKNPSKFPEKSTKVKIGKLQFHTGFINDNLGLKLSKDDIDIDNNFDFNFYISIDYSLNTEERMSSRKWGNEKMTKDPKQLFVSNYEYNEIVENFVGTQGTHELIDEFDKFHGEKASRTIDTVPVTELRPSLLINQPQEEQSNLDTNKCDNKNESKEIPILLDLSFENSTPALKEEPNIFGNKFKEPNETNNCKTTEQLIDIFDQPFQNISLKEGKQIDQNVNKSKNDPFADLFGAFGQTNAHSINSKNENLLEKDNLSKTSQSEKLFDTLIDPIQLKPQNTSQPMNILLTPSNSNKNLNLLNASQSEKVFPSNTQAEKPKTSPVNYNINIKAEEKSMFSEKSSDMKQTSSDIFADLLGQQGYDFVKKGSSEPRTINDLRKQEILSNLDEENIKIFKWTEGKRANIRALLCSMHDILWEDAKWTKCEMHQLVTLPEVRKAYKKACLAVHPDKHIGTENESLSKLIFMELNTAWTNFNAENS